MKHSTKWKRSERGKMTDYGFWSLLPPLLAISLAIKTRQVVFSLSVGIFTGYLILANGNPIQGLLNTIEAFVEVFQSKGNTRTVLLTLVIGALIQLIKFSGGIDGFVGWMQQRLSKRDSVTTKIQTASTLTGFLIFVESNISILTVGTIFRPLFDKCGLPREKLAYLADSSSAPSCILFPLNAWGAYIMGLLVAYEQLDPFKTLVYSIPFNFYAILTLIFVFWIANSKRDFGPMKQLSIKSEIDFKEEAPKSNQGNPINMILPIALMVLSMPFFLIQSGWHATQEDYSLFQNIWLSIGEGSGSSSVLNACFIGFLTAVLMYALQGKITIKSLFEQSFKGMNEMLIMAVLMVLAFAIGNLCNELGTGIYVSRVSSPWLIPELAPALLFLISGFIAFSTGTSWGTFAIMISIAIPLATAVDANLYLAVAAVLGGGVFGDHCSPISDTTLISSLASGCDHIDHVRTQLPYALFTGSLAFFSYLVAGFLA
ncbi:MAG: Na+/H+ antiporter NhaC family protein [Bacteroidota bacterium]